MASDLAAPLPELTLMPGATITVTDANGGAPVTALTVKVFQVTPVQRATAAPILVKRSGV